jgi:hypothetical protein
MNGTRKRALILGATSDIAHAVAHELARAGYALQLAGRDVERLARDAKDIELRYHVTVSTHRLDVLDEASVAALLADEVPLADVAVCAVGLLGCQEENERDMDVAARVMATNYTGPATLFARLANRFEARGSGTLVGISSVAGDRGRATNYVYGSAKAGFTAFLSGLRNRLAGRGVHVVTVNPAFVRTRMTEDMDLPGALTAAPEEVGRAVRRAIEKRQDIIYVRPVWRLIMLVIRSIPEPIFKKLRI